MDKRAHDMHNRALSHESADMHLYHWSPSYRHAWTVNPHSHRDVEWHFVLAGHGGFRIADTMIDLLPGRLIAVPPGCEHHIVQRHAGEWTLKCSWFSRLDDTADRELLDAWISDTQSPYARNIGLLREDFIRSLEHDANARDPWRQRTAAHRFQALLCGHLAGHDRIDEHRHPAIERAIVHIREASERALRMDALAAHCELSKYYLTRLFRREMGCTPMAYHEDLRLRRGATLLCDHDYSVAETATALGYLDPYHFSRRFAQWAGVPPSRFREAQFGQ